MKKIRNFPSGANRDTNEGKIEYARHLSPKALKAFCEYMDNHRKLPNGELRDPDNWKKGFPIQSFVDSGFRHMMEVWLLHEKSKTKKLTKEESKNLKDALCGIWFNCMGFLHEEVKKD